MHDALHYVVPLLPSGTYSVMAEKKGFKRYAWTNIILPVGEHVRMDVAPDATTQTVQVAAVSRVLKSDDGL